MKGNKDKTRGFLQVCIVSIMNELYILVMVQSYSPEEGFRPLHHVIQCTEWCVEKNHPPRIWQIPCWSVLMMGLLQLRLIQMHSVLPLDKQAPGKRTAWKNGWAGDAQVSKTARQMVPAPHRRLALRHNDKITPGTSSTSKLSLSLVVERVLFW